MLSIVVIWVVEDHLCFFEKKWYSFIWSGGKEGRRETDRGAERDRGKAHSHSLFILQMSPRARTWPGKTQVAGTHFYHAWQRPNQLSYHLLPQFAKNKELGMEMVGPGTQAFQYGKKTLLSLLLCKTHAPYSILKVVCAISMPSIYWLSNNVASALLCLGITWNLLQIPFKSGSQKKKLYTRNWKWLRKLLSPRLK